MSNASSAIGDDETVYQLPPAGTKTLVLVFGIQLGQASNGKHYSSKNSRYDAMAILIVEKGLS